MDQEMEDQWIKDMGRGQLLTLLGCLTPFVVILVLITSCVHNVDKSINAERLILESTSPSGEYVLSTYERELGWREHRTCYVEAPDGTRVSVSVDSHDAINATIEWETETEALIHFEGEDVVSVQFTAPNVFLEIN